MKKINIVVLIISLLVGTQAIAKIAEVMAPVGASDPVETKREVIKEQSDETSVEKTNVVDTNIDSEEIKSKLTEDMIKDLRECKPLDENYDFDLFGLSLTFGIKINGWVDKKCEYHMSAKVKNLSDDFRKSFGINVSNDKISKIEPKVECAFTKKQLNLLVDSVIEEDKRNVKQINKMLNDPNYIYELPSTNELTPSEKKLMDLLSQGEVCTVVNMDELIQQFSELMQSTTPTK